MMGLVSERNLVVACVVAEEGAVGVVVRIVRGVVRVMVL